jgi:NDP-sugar pyrophosphorylase family protein
MVTSALVLAAGVGSRLRALSGDLPKPLTLIAGVPLLTHNLRWLRQSGVDQVFINLHYKGQRIKDVIGDGAGFGLEIDYVFEPELLGTAGALANLGDRFERSMFVVYGDNLCRFSLADLAATHRSAAPAATIALFDPDHHANTGIAGGRVTLANDGRITGFIEGAGDSGSLVNTGVYVVEPGIKRQIAPGRLVDFGREVFPALLASRARLQGHVIETGGFCLGLDTPEAYQRGVELLAHRVVELEQ